jgi:hypothetical protein
MPLPTPEQFLAKLAASPTDAAAFDAATRRERPHCKTRREAVVATLGAIDALQAENVAKLEQLRLARQKIASIESAKAINSRLKAELAHVRARIVTLKTKPAPVAPNVLAVYQAMPAGQAKADFLRKNAVAIQSAAKLKS